MHEMDVGLILHAFHVARTAFLVGMPNNTIFALHARGAVDARKYAKPGRVAAASPRRTPRWARPSALARSVNRGKTNAALRPRDDPTQGTDRSQVERREPWERSDVPVPSSM